MKQWTNKRSPLKPFSKLTKKIQKRDVLMLIMMSAPLSISSRRNCRPYLWSYVERISGIERERERDTKNSKTEKVRMTDREAT